MNKKKKILLISIIVIVLLIALMYALVLIFENINDKKEQEAQKSETTDAVTLEFYDADYDENIFEDEEYSALIEYGFIKYTDEDYNITLGITSLDDAMSHGNAVGFLYEYIYAIIEGNANLYNTFFSDEYYKENEPRERFTMQKLYDVVITKKSVNASEESLPYNKYVYALEYKILYNNGTFRDDFNTGAKTQYIIITDRNGNLLIDSIY